MKCLRCGREMGNKLECDCGHFYESNVDEKSTKRRKAKETSKIIVVIVLGLISIGVIFVGPFLVYYNKSKESKINQQYQMYNHYCSIKCEGDDFSIEGNYCVCEPGKKFLIEE